MTEPEPNLSRTDRKKNRKWSNNLLNILIAVVVVLIIIYSANILGGGKDNEKVSEEEILPSEEATANKKDEKVDSKDEDLKESNNVKGSSDKKADNSDEEVDAEKSGVVTYVSSDDDDLIAETIINTAWEPIGTKQTGDHVSLYDGNSDDWNEKKEALAYATGLSVDSMIFKKIKNGGSPQESIGIVSSRDGAEKYRVYLQWVDEKGWKPVKMDVLTSLNFDY